ncbi:MAG: tyrosine-type recombinase/integrase [Acidaminococcus fermentans]|nr:tyrosine-type recombinase/integrase [Acidaminococcus fermentans]
MEKNKTGFVFRETYVDHLTGKRHKVSVTMPTGSRIAQKAAREKLDQLISEKQAAEAPTKLFELIDDYMAAQKPFVKPTTYKNYITTRKKLLQFFPPDTLVGKLTPAMIQKVLDQIVLKNSVVYAGKILTLVRRSLDRAYKLGILHSMELVNRVEIKRPPKTIQAVENQREKYLDQAELKQVLAALRKLSPLVADACELQSRTGLRFGELAALRDEDYEGDSIYVNGTLQWGLGKGEQPVRGTPKNVYSIRHVALDRRSREILDYYMLKNKRRRAWYPTVHDAAGEHWIFCTREGGPLDITFVNHMLKKIKFPKKLTTHIFRHTHISLLAEQGVPLKAIMQRVGHNDPTTTMAIYTHVTEDMAEQAVKALDAIK